MRKNAAAVKIMHLSLRGENGARLNTLSATTFPAEAHCSKQFTYASRHQCGRI